MPNRILKESFKSSPEIEQLTWFEECLWNRLIVTVDDYGRFDGRPVMLKNELFPVKENVTKKAVETAIAHLEQLGLVRLYIVDDRPYIFIPTWDKHQQIRAKKSKFPAPDSIGNQMISDDIKCYRNPIQSESNIQSESESNISSENRTDEWFEEWWSLYPKKVGKGKCRERFKKIVTSEEKFNQLIDAIKQQNKVYENREVRYIPNPETWLNQGRWEDDLQPTEELPNPGDMKKEFERVFGRVE